MKNFWKKWRILIIVLVMLPMVVFFPGCNCSCSCGKDNNSNDSSNNENVYYSVHFYTGTPAVFNIPDQQVRDGGLVIDPDIGRKNPGYRLVGWYTSKTFEDDTVWTFNIDTVHSDMWLYVRWEKI